MNNYINYNVKKSNLALKHSFGLIFQKIETMFFIILSLILVITSKIQPNFNAKISNIVVNVSTPISSFVVWPFNTGIYLVTSFNELVKAKEEKAKADAALAALELEASNQTIDAARKNADAAIER